MVCSRTTQWYVYIHVYIVFGAEFASGWCTLKHSINIIEDVRETISFSAVVVALCLSDESFSNPKFTFAFTRWLLVLRFCFSLGIERKRRRAAEQLMLFHTEIPFGCKSGRRETFYMYKYSFFITQILYFIAYHSNFIKVNFQQDRRKMQNI